MASEETFFEKKEALEKIKNLSTTDQVMRSERFVNNKMIPCILKFVFCSNHEDNFIKLNKNSSRFWVIKVNPITKKNLEGKSMMQNEIPYFLDFIINREIINPKRDRMWFSVDQIRTKAFENVVANSEPNVIKEIRYNLEDYFHRFGVKEVMLTANDLNTYFGIKGEKNYINRAIKEYLNVNRYQNKDGNEVLKYYTFFTEDLADSNKFITHTRRGRPCVFRWEDFLKSEPTEITEAEQEPVEQNAMDFVDYCPY